MLFRQEDLEDEDRGEGDQDEDGGAHQAQRLWHLPLASGGTFFVDVQPVDFAFKHVFADHRDHYHCREVADQAHESQRWGAKQSPDGSLA